MPTVDPRELGEPSRRVVVKFRDSVVLPYEDGAERHVIALKLGPWTALADRFKGIRLARLFTAASPERLGELVARATSRDPRYQPSNLLTYFVIDAPDATDTSALAYALREWEHVESAYVDPLDSLPSPPPNPQSGAQTYLKPPAVAVQPAPQGAIDAEFAWLQPGGTGTGQKIVDLERGAKLNHEDLKDLGINTLHGNNDPSLDAQTHGASVLGIVAAVDNTLGIIGIAHGVGEVAYSSQVVPVTSANPNGVDRVNAVVKAIEHFMQPGDPLGRVLLLEVHLNPTNDPMPLTHIDGTKWTWMPMETAPADFEIIRLATALGIVVIEAAGNGGRDLDVFQQQMSGGKFVLSRTHPGDFKESGAIMVGGSTWLYPYVRWVDAGSGQASCFGSRVDCFAWAEHVMTCMTFFGWDFYDYFGGTSSASAIVAGAALLVQGVVQASPASRLGPGQMRALLSDPDLNTRSANYPVDRIGVMPNLKRIIQDGLQLAPDVYIRDYVGDTGDVHAGAISASPDVIVLSALPSNAAVSLGPTTAGNDSLGLTAVSGQDNFVYVRVWNRGGVAATGVTAKVFYASAATLLTFDAWTLIGEVTIPNVPPGNVMTVSDPITWLASDVPPPGHYCFIALVGNAQDPAPDGATFLNFDYYCAYIRTNNNVTWRNIDVIAALALESAGGSEGEDDAYDFEFTAPGAGDIDRDFQLAVGSRLPPGSRVWLEAPYVLLERLPIVEVDTERAIARIPIQPHGRTTLPSMLLPAGSRSKCHLHLQVSRTHRDGAHEVYVSQLYRDLEVGRITWRIVPKR
jgi:hypothetical protein